MLILTEKEIQNHYVMKDAISDLKKGLNSKKQGLITNPHRTVIEIPDNQASVLYMPGAELSQKIASVKVVSIFPKNPKHGMPTTQGILMLTDAQTGKHLCMMNASYLTRLRTGGLSGIATEKLARKDVKTLGVIGTGAMAFEQVLGVLEVRDIDKINLFNRTQEKAEQFKERLIDFGVKQPITIAANADEVVQAADVICCATRSNEPVFNGDLLKDGTHINGVGSYLPHMQEVDLTTIQKASKIVADDLKGVEEEAGELIHADRESDWSFTDLYGELSGLPDHNGLVRENDKEITFFKSVGAAYFDLVVAIGIYSKLQEIGVGSEVEV
ncbi:ornithine cyclodeaminase [Virgibacillus natechei]|uniref:Ornithine cyclodeaminase n=1 Tax=Virgibacillus natechei TaxID=1216297 RepID=A0ABS4IDR0_9BACI|nr:ornithine cyclodeaminase family protein [Virgibacillus natechei]MBP1969077.1 ornithine cyclodeaminase [Virgibacillus natechei]UZD14346.1 ornithine cyclodeaminase family protein [Virgibacillus natechei]